MHFYNNAGSVLFLKLLFSRDIERVERARILQRSETFFMNSLLMEGNDSSRRGLGWVEHIKGNESDAVDYWREVGWTSDDFIQMGDNFYAEGDYAKSLKWYFYATLVGQESWVLWDKIGRSCQHKGFHGDLCRRYLVKNFGNFFVNSSMDHGMLAWRYREKHNVICEIKPCPDRTKANCIHIVNKNSILDHGVGCWHQCLQIEPGREYIFSAYIKVVLADNGQWRPIYHQGDVDDEPKGHWPGYQEGSSNWRYWEKSFIASTYNQDWACFYPILLEGQGEAWIRDVSLRLLSNEK